MITEDNNTIEYQIKKIQTIIIHDRSNVSQAEFTWDGEELVVEAHNHFGEASKVLVHKSIAKELAVWFQHRLLEDKADG
jgi:hypothetical protein